ncbi:MAG: transposase [Chloroflexota bacterium]|nr:transposase [Chloroflexota bacterium]
MSAVAPQCRVGSEVTPSLVAEALRRHGDRYGELYGLDPAHRRVVTLLCACRTAALGVHLCVCQACGWEAAAYNSCRDRHCSQCQGHATALWLEARQERMLPTPHFQVVFTLPDELRAIAYDNQKEVYGLLFKAASSILRDLARQSLSARLGITAVLHTWTSELTYHPHLHCVVTGGGLRRDGARWVPTKKGYLFPGRKLGTMFRGRFLDGLIAAFHRGELHLRGHDDVEAARAFHATVQKLANRHRHWVVHVEAPKGRSVGHLTKYLARYIKRVAITDGRISEITDTHVTFKTKRGPLTLDGVEFVRRFLLHVLPRGLRKVRHYGLYAPGMAKTHLEAARRLLPDGPTEQRRDVAEPAVPPGEARPLEPCPACGQLAVLRIFSQADPLQRPRPPP